MTARSGIPGHGGTWRQDIDEDAVVRKYVHLKWPVTRLARQYRSSNPRIEAILAGRGVELRAAAQLDEAAVLAAFARHGSVSYVAAAMGASQARIAAILDSHGVPRADTPGVPEYSNAARSRHARARKLQPAAEPSPCDLLVPAQAARIARISPADLKAAAKAGQIAEARSPHGYRRYVRRDVEDYARRLISGSPRTAEGGQR